MSIPGRTLTLTAIQGAGLAFLQSLMGRSVTRGINWQTFDPVTGAAQPANVILPHITIDERHLDSMSITEHPVEQGAGISDHAYKNPAELVVRYGWSKSGGSIAPGTSILTIPSNITIIPTFSDPNVLNVVYDRLLKLQEASQLVNVVTGKRSYFNMLIAAIQVDTDRRSENVLDIRIVFRQIVIAKTQIATVPPKEQQQMPDKTAPQENGGTKQLEPAPNFNPAGAD